MAQVCRVAILGSVLAAAVAAATARAQPFTEHLDPIEAAAAARLADFPEPETRAEFARSRALEKCVRSYQRNSTSPDRDLATLGSIANSLERAFPDDPEFGLVLDDALDAFRSPLASARDRIAAFIEGRIDPLDPRYGRATAGLEALDGHLERAADATTRRSAAAAFRHAIKASTVAWKRAIGLDRSFGRRFLDKVGVGVVTALVDGVPFDAQAIFTGYLPASNGLLLFECVDFLDPVPDRARVLAVVVFGVFGPGTYSISTAFGLPSGEYRDLRSISPIVSEGDFQTQGSGSGFTGTITVTTLDLERKLVEGTFAFEAFSATQPPANRTRSVTNGAFRSRLLRARL